MVGHFAMRRRGPTAGRSLGAANEISSHTAGDLRGALLV
jgi:hypothetical protein